MEVLGGNGGSGTIILNGVGVLGFKGAYYIVEVLGGKGVKRGEGVGWDWEGGGEGG